MADLVGNFKIIGELCTCGHTRARHRPHGKSDVENGHGDCEECSCEIYTWAAWVVK